MKLETLFQKSVDFPEELFMLNDIALHIRYKFLSQCKRYLYLLREVWEEVLEARGHEKTCDSCP